MWNTKLIKMKGISNIIEVLYVLLKNFSEMKKPHNIS